MFFQVFDDHLENTLQVLTLADCAGDLVEQFKPGQLGLRPSFGTFTLGNFPAQRLVRGAQGVLTFLDAVEHLVECVGQQPCFVPALASRADRIVFAFGDVAGSLGQGQNGPGNGTL